MSSFVHSVLGAALLLAGASAAMAASETPPLAGQPAQASAATATTASTNAPVAGQPAQTGAVTTTAATAAAPVVAQAPKPHHPSVPDNNDPYGGNDPNSVAGVRAFFVPQY